MSSPGIRILKVEERHNTPVHLRVAVHEPMFPQVRYERFRPPPDAPGFGDNDVQHRHRMRHLFRFLTSQEGDVASELLKKIIDGQS